MSENAEDRVLAMEVEALLGTIDPGRQAFARMIWDRIPHDGTPISNLAIRKATKTVTNRDYPYARNALREKGLIVLGGGRTGTVLRAEPFRTSLPPPSEHLTASLELALYEPIMDQLRARVQNESRFDGEPIVAVTGQQGARRTGGIWSRPDITVVAYKRFKVLAGVHLEVHTYEVKTGAGFDIRALHEARAHRRRAHRSYVIVDYENERHRGQVENLVDEARELGVGLMGFHAVDSDWEVWYEPPIHHPDPIELDEFLASQLGPSVEQIRMWSALPALTGTE